jgi:hypothetical protein
MCDQAPLGIGTSRIGHRPIMTGPPSPEATADKSYGPTVSISVAVAVRPCESLTVNTTTERPCDV